jgi:hypothetical protein
MVSTSRLSADNTRQHLCQGSVVSAIGNIISTIIYGIADVILIIVNSIITVGGLFRINPRLLWY